MKKSIKIKNKSNKKLLYISPVVGKFLSKKDNLKYNLDVIYNKAYLKCPGPDW